MESSAQRALARQIKRNVVLGTVFAFLLTMAICLPAGIGWGRAAMVAVLPAGFAGPFVGGLASVVTWVLAEERKTQASAPVEASTPPEPAPSTSIATPDVTPAPALA